MHLQEFSLGASLIHRLDPRVKILCALLFSAAVSVNNSVGASFMAALFPAVLILMARISLRQVLSRLAIVNGFIAFLWLFLPFSASGQPLWSIGPLHVTGEGLHAALLITLKSNAIVLATMVFLGTSPFFDLAHALGQMGLPDKLVYLFYFSFRYLGVIQDEYHRLVEAAKVRGFQPGTNLHTYRTYAYFIGMLLVRSFERSGRILDAMKLRGFHGKFYVLHHYQVGPYDYVLAGVSALVSAALIVVTLVA